MSEAKRINQARLLTEGGICIAMSIALSYLKIPIGMTFGGFGGSIDLVMVPLVFYALKWGPKWGCLAGLIFGSIKYFIGNGLAIHWISIVFDYSVAYAAVGLAGIIGLMFGTTSPIKNGIGAFIGCLGRFIIHFISGVTVYAQYMPEEFINHKMTSPTVYSLLYNGTYMLPNTILCILIIAIITKPLKRIFEAK